MSTSNWNVLFTNLVRQSNPGLWGNFALDTSIESGAVGFFTAGDTPNFNKVAMLPAAPVTMTKSSQTWAIESSTVKRTQTSVEFKGGYKDPSTDTEVNGGLEVAWTFGEENSMASNGTLIGQTSVDDYAEHMLANYDWMLPLATANGFASGKDILQGFGMITDVQVCSGGINIGSSQSDNTFSLTGSVDGISAMTGGGSANASVKASYKECTQSKSFESRMWPTEPNSTADDSAPIGITYQFASFHGKLIMPTWIEPISAFSLVFDNAHGGTYIANIVVTYDVPGPPVKTWTHAFSLSGGRTAAMDPIPLNATNINVTIHFRFSSHVFYQRYPNPLVTWLNGQKTFDIYGVWSAKPYVKVRS